MSNSRVERKVSVASLSAALSGVLVWVLSTYVFHGVVPEGVQSLLDVAIPAVSAFVSGWLVKHTPRQEPVLMNHVEG